MKPSQQSKSWKNRKNTNKFDNKVLYIQYFDNVVSFRPLKTKPVRRPNKVNMSRSEWFEQTLLHQTGSFVVFTFCLPMFPRAKECGIITMKWISGWTTAWEGHRGIQGCRTEWRGYTFFVDRWAGRNRRFIVCGLIRQAGVLPSTAPSPRQHNTLDDFSPLLTHRPPTRSAAQSSCSHELVIRWV